MIYTLQIYLQVFILSPSSLVPSHGFAIPSSYFETLFFPLLQKTDTDRKLCSGQHPETNPKYVLFLLSHP